ncbi:MAG: dTDP-glucose 4,6-dehydratase [Candidatus Portnoybacteria bacterium RIFCSPHIGHO2_12_FULL_40_11]|uniref:dTDP-glucose 4,6-dehydratase n=2 Tax=Candidatus Portnoyibacteriota TaxID=1817913 RepID=A0A1G2FSK7_9BACT|nr:MAG: dTDP-glucose 4,6-dehydratase [Candidatus Portnoybacteria bacterium RIFCSPHIGHO2_12_FULL_40_11]OGZ41055.1 MAG: dTDP-glucose 4,6-dehydratase [Candidatus Portnoybacteria bacterium RIFCSPLOWO2_02_FULL_40_15]
MNLLITGGAGFIGSNFIRHILNKYPGYKIINLDKLTYAGNLSNLRDIENNPRYGFVRGDICDRKLVNFLVSKRPDAILNFAAETHVDRSILAPQDFIKTDILGTHTLLEAAKKYRTDIFIQISTDEVYGSILNGSFVEESPLRPNSPYSASKAGADLMVRAYQKTFAVPTLITRSSNNFGPFQYPEKLIPLFITNLLEDKKVPVYGDGEQVRDWVYVLDNCSGIDYVLHNGQIGEIYNISGNTEKTNLDITKIILTHLGKNESYIEYVKDRPGHDRRYSLSFDKLYNLGWRPRYDFSEAMAKTIQWYKENPDWWQKIKSGEYLEYYREQYGK